MLIVMHQSDASGQFAMLCGDQVTVGRFSYMTDAISTSSNAGYRLNPLPPAVVCCCRTSYPCKLCNIECCPTVGLVQGLGQLAVGASEVMMLRATQLLSNIDSFKVGH
jgi:hypothetical protein